MSKFENNLTKGSVLKQLIFFSIPFLISNIVQSLYNLADMLIVGNFSGTNSVSGVNIGGQVTFILTNLAMGICNGGTILVAQYLGANDRKSLKQTVGTLIMTVAYIGIAMTVGLFLFRKQILELINTPPESFAEANSYLTVTILGIIFIIGYNALSAILRGMGDTKRPFYFVLVACITNIVLDLIFVGQFGMGAFGAAVATVISQALSVILCIIYLVRNDFIFDFRLKSFKLVPEKAKLILKLGLPAAVQNGVTNVSFLLITVLVNGYGVNASAGVGIVGKINSFVIMPIVAMSTSISTIAAQNIGAEKWDRAVKSMKLGTILSFVFSLIVFFVVQRFPGELIALFDRNPEVINEGTIYMRSFSTEYMVLPILFCMNGLFIATGHTTFSLVNSLFSSILLRVPAAYLLGSVLNLGMRGIGFGAPVASFGMLLVVLWFYFTGRWRVNVAKTKTNCNET